MYVKPAPGVRVIDPNRGDYLPEGGREVPDEQYWFRRLECGDVVAAEPPESEK